MQTLSKYEIESFYGGVIDELCHQMDGLAMENAVAFQWMMTGSSPTQETSMWDHPIPGEHRRLLFSNPPVFT